MNHPSDKPSLERDLEVAESKEVPGAELCLRIARAYAQSGEHAEAYTWLARVVDAGESFRSWNAAAGLLTRLREQELPPARRNARVALTGTYTTTQLGALLRLAALRCSVDLDLEESGYQQYRQELLDPQSALYAFDPEFVVLATHDGALELPDFSTRPSDEVAREVERWVSLWETVGRLSKARVLQHGFALRTATPFGNLSISLPGSRYAMSQAVNAALGAAAVGRASMVDCERLASTFGKNRWFDDRYWYAAKQAVALDAVPVLARHTAAVLSAQLGLSRKCVVLDLDNTLWGGVIGEDGLTGIRLGAGVEGEAFVAFQHYLLSLRERGILLAVVSKNDEADAREPFERHPEMVLRLDDFAAFMANWEDKPSNLRRLADLLDIGLDALALVDDNPAERQMVRRLVPEVDVVPLPPDPSAYVRAMNEYLRLEPSSFTSDDRARTTQYHARAQARELAQSASSIEDFYRSLKMRAHIAPFDELNLPRIVQLINKTNQFNLTARRYDVDPVRRMMNDERFVHLCLRLEDNLADHGLVAVLIAERSGDALDIDTWLMSCRVIRRTVENALASQLCRRALELGYERLQGTYVPSVRNSLVAELYSQLGFDLVDESEGRTTWEYDIASKGIIENDYIEVA